MMTEEKLRGMFLAQFARLAEQAGTYVGRMNRRDRERVLESALRLAVDLRDEYKPREMSLVYYWDRCLKSAVRYRVYWNLRHFDRWALVPSKKIGLEIKLPTEDEA